MSEHHRKFLGSLFIYLMACARGWQAGPQGLKVARFVARSTCVAYASSDELGPGLLIEFTSKDGNAALGIIQERDGKKNWKVLTGSGSVSSLSPRSITHILPVCAIKPGTEQDVIARHQAAADEQAKQMPLSALEDVWAMASEDTSATLSLLELSELLCGDGTSENYFATRYVLSTPLGRALFKSNKAGTEYTPRPETEVSSLQAQAQAAAAAAAQAEQGLRDRIRDAVTASPPTFDISKESDQVQSRFSALEAYACRAYQEDPEKEVLASDEEAAKLLKSLGRKVTAESGRQLLVAIGLWSKHENLELRRLQVPTEFDSALEATAAEILQTPCEDVDASRRCDFTHLLSLAIDETSTVEVDDAVSVEDLGEDGMRLWVHIADPTRYIGLGSPLEREARARMSSLYLPTGTVPMFPMGLASGPLSLRPGYDSCALSFGVRLDPAGGIDLVDVPPQITPSLVRVRRVTYAEVDEALTAFSAVPEKGTESVDNVNGSGERSTGGDADGSAGRNVAMTDEDTLDALRRLEFLSAQRREWRISCGSIERIAPESLPDMNIKARPDVDAPDGWHVDVRAADVAADGAARRIVTEAMLLAGEAAAAYAREHDIPLAFRVQEAREDLTDEEVADCPDGVCRAWLAIRSMGRSALSHEPRPHEGLGLNAYTQVTSPIRRHNDLLAHYQLKAHLRGQALPFPAEKSGKSQIVSIAAAAVTSPVRALERKTNAYWLVEYLSRRAGEPMHAIVLGSERKRDVYKLLLPQLGALVDCESSEPLHVGDTINVAADRSGKVDVCG